jgi:hypothetical protein
MKKTHTLKKKGEKQTQRDQQRQKKINLKGKMSRRLCGRRGFTFVLRNVSQSLILSHLKHFVFRIQQKKHFVRSFVFRDQKAN